MMELNLESKQDFDVKNNPILCKIICMDGHEFHVEAHTQETFQDLKNKILQKSEVVNIYKSPEDFHLVLNGRVVRNHNEKIGSLVDSNATFFINASNIHGGCCPNYCG